MADWLKIILLLSMLTLIIYLRDCEHKKVEARYTRAIVGEASDQGYHGMLAVASGIRNRGTLEGVYGLYSDHVDNEPGWVWEMAHKAWLESRNNRIHPGTHWYSKRGSEVPYWANTMVSVYEYKDHVFLKED